MNILKSLVFIVFAFIFVCCEGCRCSPDNRIYYTALPSPIPAECEGYRFTVGASGESVAITVVKGSGEALGVLLFEGVGANAVFSTALPDDLVLRDYGPPIVLDGREHEICLSLSLEDESGDVCLSAMRGTRRCIPLYPAPESL